jgi:DNA replication protein DnaC
MEKKVDEAIRQKVGTAKFKDPYEHIELSEEEIDTALRKARHDKAAAIKEREYFESLSKPKTYPSLTLAQFREGVLAKIRMKIPNYTIDEYNERQFEALCLYFMRDPKLETIENGRFKLNKGWALLGPIGCGKTSLISGFNINPTNCFGITSCRVVAAEYSEKEGGGAATIKRYSKPLEVPAYDNWGQKNIGLLFDDLGTENAKKHFGNESNVMEEIILNRYDNFELTGKTHFTSNLTAELIEDNYGPRVRSRLRQMCNFLVFEPRGGDRRK